MFWNPAITIEVSMSNYENDFYRSIINTLKSLLVDLDSCFASIDAKQSLGKAIEVCELDLQQRQDTSSGDTDTSSGDTSSGDTIPNSP